MRKEIKQSIFDSFDNVFSLKDKENFKNNALKSSKFVFELSKRIRQILFPEPEYKLNVQEINDDGEKKSGEWLFDMCITKKLNIKDDRYEKSVATINTEIVFALECEFATGITNFAKDFGKLICSDAKYKLYIQGLNQTTETGRIDFINSRKQLIQFHLKDVINNIFIGFIPSPEKSNENESLWNIKDIKNWIEIYYFEDGKFEKL